MELNVDFLFSLRLHTAARPPRFYEKLWKVNLAGWMVINSWMFYHSSFILTFYISCKTTGNMPVQKSNDWLFTEEKAEKIVNIVILYRRIVQRSWKERFFPLFSSLYFGFSDKSDDWKIGETFDKSVNALLACSSALSGCSTSQFDVTLKHVKREKSHE